MNVSSLLMGFLPLLVFVIVDAFASMKTALIVAVVLALAEAVYSMVAFGSLDSVTLASFVLLAIMAAGAYFKNDEKLFLFQPVVLSFGLGTYLLVTYFMGQNIFYEMAMKYINVFPAEVQYALKYTNILKAIFAKFSLWEGLALYVHAAITAFAALKLNKWWWVGIRGVGFYGVSFIAFYISKNLAMAEI